ncbi:hypothetical protein C8J56DRAFT_1062135 [Mycena floridula]|nr:hypothetical protein C8J56DRAFT_1062135 [Mycena floridula]
MSISAPLPAGKSSFPSPPSTSQTYEEEYENLSIDQQLALDQMELENDPHANNDDGNSDDSSDSGDDGSCSTPTPSSRSEDHPVLAGSSPMALRSRLTPNRNADPEDVAFMTRRDDRQRKGEAGGFNWDNLSPEMQQHLMALVIEQRKSADAASSSVQRSSAQPSSIEGSSFRDLPPEPSKKPQPTLSSSPKPAPANRKTVTFAPEPSVAPSVYATPKTSRPRPAVKTMVKGVAVYSKPGSLGSIAVGPPASSSSSSSTLRSSSASRYLLALTSTAVAKPSTSSSSSNPSKLSSSTLKSSSASNSSSASDSSDLSKTTSTSKPSLATETIRPVIPQAATSLSTSSASTSDLFSTPLPRPTLAAQFVQPSQPMEPRPFTAQVARSSTLGHGWSPLQFQSAQRQSLLPRATSTPSGSDSSLLPAQKPSITERFQSLEERLAHSGLTPFVSPDCSTSNHSLMVADVSSTLVDNSSPSTQTPVALEIAHSQSLDGGMEAVASSAAFASPPSSRPSSPCQPCQPFPSQDPIDVKPYLLPKPDQQAADMLRKDIRAAQYRSIDLLFNELAYRLGESLEEVVEHYSCSVLKINRPCNSWNLFQRYLAQPANFDTLTAKLDGTVNEFSGSGPDDLSNVQAAAIWEIYKQEKPSYKVFLQDWADLQDTTVSITPHARARDFNKYVEDLKYQATRTQSLKGYETTFIVAGNMVNGDSSLAETFSTQYASNFTSRLGYDEHSIVGLFKTEVYDAVAKELVNKVRKAAGLPPLKDVPAKKEVAAAVAKETKDTLTAALRSKYCSLAEAAGFTLSETNFQWKEMTRILAELGFQLVNFPYDAQFPHMGSGKGLSAVPVLSRQRMLAKALDLVAPMKFVPQSSSELLSGTIPVIVCAAQDQAPPKSVFYGPDGHVIKNDVQPLVALPPVIPFKPERVESLLAYQNTRLKAAAALQHPPTVVKRTRTQQAEEDDEQDEELLPKTKKVQAATSDGPMKPTTKASSKKSSTVRRQKSKAKKHAATDNDYVDPSDLIAPTPAPAPAPTPAPAPAPAPAGAPSDVAGTD